MSKQFVRDALERILVTAVLAGIGVGMTEVANLSPMYAVPIAAVLNALKVYVAQNYGDPNTGGFTGGNVVDEDYELTDDVSLDEEIVVGE
jgi:hypothetical protein